MSEFNKILSALHEGVIDIVFVKEDGTTRRMLATLREDLIEDDKAFGDEPILAWDLEVGDWRSFRLERIESWEKGKS